MDFTLNEEQRVWQMKARQFAADKLVRDGIIWTHLAGDSLSRIKTVKKLAK